jgi:hypothetical protein
MHRRTAEDDHDVVLLHGTTDDGEGLKALRSRPGRLDLAEIRPVHEGQHVGEHELVSLRPREVPVVCDVDVVYRPGDEMEAADHAGPARVATDAYRMNWEAIFGGPSDDLLN